MKPPFNLSSYVGRRLMPAAYSLFFHYNRPKLLVEQLVCAFRRLAGDVLHRHALLEIGSTMGPSWRLGAAVERVGEDQPKPESVNRDE